jgi:hypothetical protein
MKWWKKYLLFRILTEHLDKELFETKKNLEQIAQQETLEYSPWNNVIFKGQGTGTFHCVLSTKDETHRFRHFLRKLSFDIHSGKELIRSYLV